MSLSSKLHFLLAISFLVFLFACQEPKPKAIITTEIGTIEVELFTDLAPITAKNFILYINEDRFKGATFYRTVTMDNQPDSKVKIEVIQGGLFEDDHPQMLAPIKHESTKETGILHKDGVISMARYGPGTATSEFFICIGDQPSLDQGGNRNSDGHGFAAFGKVVAGYEVVKKIHESHEEGQYLKPRIKILGISLKN